ncbi:alpha/beta hydrolase [Brachybacterium fresconis]|uniref:Xylan 1,4-beta-xylosidase n=1 Tax=Brachybacterium fresconis TaxID=173363 RepID=A0ABS4YK83_9MICO|nr:alpha/beta hydrolase [Brachybacterium fresconis]MBP2409216.1 xylan 1,4-beta-xylosidase [Brachybacterium fresconis]
MTQPQTTAQIPSASPAPLTPTASDEMERRMRQLGDAATWADVDPAVHRAWDEPYGPAEQWELRIEDREIPGPHGPIPVRLYTPPTAADGPRPCLVWCHGGGFMHGDLDMPEGDHVARGIAGRAGAVVVSVDYRLCDEIDGTPARELPGGPARVLAPVPLDDVCAAVTWTREHADELGIDRARAAIGGASAGGNLAAAASLRLAEDGAPLAASLLLYPVTHPISPEPTTDETAALAVTPTLLRFPPETMRAMSENYIGRALEDAVPHEFPGLASTQQLAVLPRTYLEADEFDDLRVSGRRYAEQLAEAGVDVEHVVRRGACHGHLNRVGLPQAAASMDRMAGILQEL